MKVRSFIQKISVVLMIVMLYGCSLEQKPYGFLNEKNFYKTQEDAESAISYTYAVMSENGYFSRYYYYIAHCSTEEFTQKSDAEPGQHELDSYRTTDRTADLDIVFRHCYLTINRTFPIIKNVPSIAMNNSYRNQIVGEAHFLRAYSYYTLVRLFGRVPLRSVSMTNFNEVGLGLATIQELYNFIISDLKEAERLMDTQVRVGRANKIAAQGLLANVHLFLASASESGLQGYSFADATTNYNEAKTYAGNVVNGQAQYSLDPNIFNIFDPNQYFSPEHIFLLNVSREVVSPLNMQSLLSTPFVQGGFTLPANQGGYTIDFGWAHVLVEIPFYDSFASNDLRKNTLFATSYRGVESGQVVSYPNNGLSRPFTIKYLDTDRSGTGAGGNKVPIIRFSEVLLTYAEASGLSTEGINALNQIRQRAGLPTYTMANFTGDRDFRDAVIQERSWELAYEYHRLFDLRRTRKMEEVLQTQYGKTLIQNAYFFPIPFTEVSRNPEL